MAYLVLARRYRPQSFTELIGQEHIITILTNAINSGRIHHAFLFTGARGTGKTSTARLLAKALNCENGPTPNPCNTCSHCTDIMAGKEVDVLEIDGATNTGVENVRALREDIRFLPSSGRYRVVIIDEVHMLTVSAFNALLKTLEEPPSHVIFIFATTEPHKIPATILSRVQRFDFKRVALSRLTQHVTEILEKEGFKIEEEAATLIAIEGEGSVRDTLSILDQILANQMEGEITARDVAGVLGLTDRQVLRDVSEALLLRDGAKVFTLLNKVFYEGYDIVHFTKSLVGWLRDLLVVKTVDDPEGLVSLTERELSTLRTFLSPYTPQHIHHMFLRLFNGFDSVSRSLTPKTALELLLMDIVLAEPLSPAKELFHTLSQLENAVKSGVSNAAPQRFQSTPPSPERGAPAQPQHPRQAVPAPAQPIQQKSAPRGTSLAERFSSLAGEPPKSAPPPPQKASTTAATASSTAQELPGQSGSFGFKQWTTLLDSISKSHGRAFVVLQGGRFSSRHMPGGGIEISLVFPDENAFSMRYINAERRTLELVFSEKLGLPVTLVFEDNTKENMGPSWQKLPEGVPVASPWN